MRRKTKEVLVGKIGIGGENPIRIQSMTTSNTRDIPATVEQIIRLADHGCEIVRVTVQGKKEAEACEGIKNTLLKKGYTIPLCADIHFYPPAALIVCDFVDKVRINPGNFADRRALFIYKEYDPYTYAKELEKIEEAFAPLVLKCKAQNKPIRIGANHGSLSDRIMNQYGNTPQGMVASALEYADICRKYDFHAIVFSMKASNPLLMIEAYRKLVEEMQRLSWDYPIHLGVTEAGAEEDGRVKSAVGIGTLLVEGIGDTIRVSLTEDPLEEIEPCKRLVNLWNNYREHNAFSKPRKGSRSKGELFRIEEVPKTATLVTLKTPKVARVREMAKQKENLILLLDTDCPIVAGAECGPLLLDGSIDGIAVDSSQIALGESILQATRHRITKTEFISCPGCGRTLFDLQEVSKKIREKTSHLPGVRIAIMGCIVNGPGEMADADFGYVGSKTGKVDLYIGKQCVEKDIDHLIADERLIALIKQEGKWKDMTISG